MRLQHEEQTQTHSVEDGRSGAIDAVDNGNEAFWGLIEEGAHTHVTTLNQVAMNPKWPVATLAECTLRQNAPLSSTAARNSAYSTHSRRCFASLEAKH